MSYLGLLTAPFTTRATVVRLPGGLWVHSPTELDDTLAAALEALAPVRWIVAPNRLHTTWIGDWAARFPAARVLLAPGVKARGDRLGRDPPEEWEGRMAQWIAPGDLMDEAVFLHRPSGTLVLTDLIQNVEPARVRSRGWRWMMTLFGAADPDGSRALRPSPHLLASPRPASRHPGRDPRPPSSEGDPFAWSLV